jgi:transcriptional regulator GlxA family with amidase domain
MNEPTAVPKDIAFVVYPGLATLDLFGPLQVMTALTPFTQDYRPVVVGETLEPVDTDSPARLLPDKTFAQVPHPFGLIVPGGAAPTMKALGNETLISYIRSAGKSAEVVGSVCTGALILAAAGHLDGRNAATHWAFSKQLERLGSHYVAERWVEDGKFITSAGITAGIDMALQLVARLAGEDVARQVQLLLEYDPHPPLGGIDWDAVDRNMLDPLVDQWIWDGLAEKPALASTLTKGL